MTTLIPAALYGWPLVVIVLFVTLGPRRAIVAGFVAGWLFLPSVPLPNQGFIDIDKRAAISLGALLAAVLLDSQRVFKLRLSIFDLPILLWSLSGLTSSLANGLGLYDGLTSSLTLVIRWAIPWFLGRIYLASPKGLADLCSGVFVGGLVYAPLCLWEVRMSPTLHRWIYGVTVYGEGIAFRELGKWGTRPSVFMMNTLEVGMYMTSACVSGLAIRWLKGQRSLPDRWMSWLVGGLVVVAILCKNLGATALLLAGAFALRWVRVRRSWLPVYLLASMFPLYIAVRTNGMWGGEEIVELAALIHEGKASSFAFRIHHEDLLLQKAMLQPFLGWGGWGRWRVFDEYGNDVTVSDGLWIMTLGASGFFGLVALSLMFLVPVVAAPLRLDSRLLSHPRIVPVVAVVVLFTLMVIDCVPNSYPSPVIILAGGGLTGLPPIREGPVRVARGATPSTYPCIRSSV